MKEAGMTSVYMLAVVMVTLSDAANHDSARVMKSNAVTRLRRSDQQYPIRARRQARPLSSQQILEIVDLHNALRAREGAANMELMSWNDFLASLAEQWAARCVWEHGQPSLGDNPPYTSIGQNLYATTGNTINLTAAQMNWYEEKYDYNYDTLECAAGKPCGHYTQVVWATSRHVGCAVHNCEPLTGAFSQGLYFVCNYGPAGNLVGAKPYIKGPACSKCSSGAGWCKDRLCNSECTSAGAECLCGAHCYNCATLDDRTCRCSCADGWHGPDCSVPCKDTHQYCNRSPGWPPSTCGTDYVQKACPAMCQLCTEDPDAVEDQCEPVYGPDAHLSAQSTFSLAQQAMITLLTLLVALAISYNAVM